MDVDRQPQNNVVLVDGAPDGGGGGDDDMAFANTLASEQFIVERVPGDQTTRLPVPMLSLWMQSRNDVQAYRNTTFQLVKMPLPPDIGQCMGGQAVQPFFIDSATATWLHGRARVSLTWQAPDRPGVPPHLSGLTASKACISRADLRARGGIGIGMPLRAVSWPEFIADFKANNARSVADAAADDAKKSRK